jgi:di/tricarboxylate transporter
VSWTTVILIAGLIPVSQAIASTGAADDVADILVDIGLSAAAELDVATPPVLMCIAIACSAAFLTPSRRRET